MPTPSTSAVAPSTIIPVSSINPPVVPTKLPPSSRPSKSARRDIFSLLVYAVLISAITVMGYFVLAGPLASVSRAVLPSRVSPAFSSLFAYPLTIPADGLSSSKVDVFLASDQGVPVVNQRVTLTSSQGAVRPEGAMTDSQGHAVFTFTMSDPGIATVEVSVNGTPIGKRLTIQGN